MVAWLHVLGQKMTAGVDAVLSFVKNRKLRDGEIGRSQAEI